MAVSIPYRPRCSYEVPLISNADLYEHLPAGHIRLLSLTGFTEQGVLKCFLHSVPLTEDLTYCALSYTWSEAENIWYWRHDTCPKIIWINRKAVQISDKVANILCLALQRDRHQVWIDSICINQTNLTEKSEQVSQMGKVYGVAVDVLCFVGEPSEVTDETIDMIHRTASTPVLQYSYGLVRNFDSLVASEYWTRAWTLQEMLLARNAIVCCGSRSVPLSNVQAFRTKVTASCKGLRIPSLRDFTAAIFDEIVWSREIYFRSGRNPSTAWASRQVDCNASPLSIMRQCRPARGCKDPRDLIYSRISLSTHFQALVPKPDYTLSVERVYTNFAANCVLITKSLEIITFATHTDLKLPTWVPDWTSTNRSWGGTLEHKWLKDVIADIDKLEWQTWDLPQISSDQCEMLVQGRLVCRLNAGLYDHFAFSVIRRTNRRMGYSKEELPKRHDALFVLKGCSNPVCLRPVHGYYILVGRNTYFQEQLDAPLIREKLRNAPTVPEAVLRIR